MMYKFMIYIIISHISPIIFINCKIYQNNTKNCPKFVKPFYTNQIPQPREQQQWSDPSIMKCLGFVSGISKSDKSNTLYVFHRGNTVYTMVGNFDENKNFQHVSKGTIPNNTIVAIDLSNGKMSDSWGSNIFYIPHGITVDFNENLWVTDFALHQVFRFKRNHNSPELTIGERLIPGNDRNHLCQPSEVAIASSGDIYIADGHCNARIIVFSYNGQYLREIRVPNGNIIHSIKISETADLVCIADRENFRILCYNMGLKNNTLFGKLMKTVYTDGSKVSAIDFINDNTIVACMGNLGMYCSQCVLIDMKSEKITNVWGHNINMKFDLPHDMITADNGRTIYVSEYHVNVQKRIYKFTFNGLYNV